MDDMHFENGQSVTFEFEGKQTTGIVDVHQRLSGFVIIKAEGPKIVAIRATQVKAA